MDETDEPGLLRAIEARPDDDEVRAVYADWLESNGRSAPAEFLRTQMALKAGAANPWEFGRLAQRLVALSLRPELSSEFRRAASRPAVEGCNTRLMFACPVTWDKMKPTRDPSVRTCDSCAKPVQYVDQIDQAREIAQRGGCIAVDPVVPRTPGDLQPPSPMLAGMVMPPREPFPAPPPIVAPGQPCPVARPAIVPPALVDPRIATALLASEEAASRRTKP